MPGITRLFSGSLIVEEGAELSFPNLVEHSQGATCAVSFWTASGPGSLLDLSRLTVLEGPSCGTLVIQALAGGRVAMERLQRVVEGRLEILADGARSVVDLSSLVRSDATRFDVLLEASNQGSLLMQQMVGGGTMGLTIRSNGMVTASRLGWLGFLTASQSSIELPGVTNLNSGSLTATEGAVVSLPSLRTYFKDPRCTADGWIARGTGSVIHLPNLVHMTGGDCFPLTVEASSGGGISLPGLTNIESGWVRVIASGLGSSVQLSKLGNFVDAERLSSLVASNGGTFDLGSIALVTSGVLLNILPGSPGLPTVELSPDQLVLHGRAWHSYRVDRFGFSATPGGLELYARVPLQSDFQSIGSAVGPGVGFVAEEFVMDPGGLDLTPLPAIGVGKRVYGPSGRTYDLLAAGTADAPWPWPRVATVILTNSFSILPDEPLSIPQRYFKLQAPLVP